jgi:hypothetical protein
MALGTDTKRSMITRLRANATAVWDVLQEARKLQQEWNAGSYATLLTDADVSAATSGLTKAEIAAAMTTLNGIVTGLNAADAANLATVKT